MAKPQQREPEHVLGETYTRAVLEELHAWCQQQNARAAHGRAEMDPGRAIGFAEVMQQIRVMQSRESLRALDGRNPLDVPPPRAA